ncbi:peptide/nickel transport system permease protein [Devosia enhydra]|uniref:Peptide/nickel transport system permease protein n=1 Tax=Devosia enhydra TaxID=665118 RepID=A0A1K2HZY3_9HYPH|nr:ABC transporter permease [Devosia enhydra]SFZ85640.1 peptide/nickel transport system permease protein [Devosia enhydra]
MGASIRSIWYSVPSLLRFVLRRLAIGVLLCIGVTFVSFTLTQVVPGDPVAASLGDYASSDPETVAAFRQRFGLDKPVHEQYVIYLTKLAQGDFGESLQTRRPVAADLAHYMSATIELAVVAMLIAMIGGVGLGIIAAITRDRWPDQVIRVVSLAGVSVPTFWLSLVCLYVFFFQLGWSPGVGRLSPGAAAPMQITGLFTLDALLTGNWKALGDALSHIALPAMVLAIYTIGAITRFTRAAMLDALGQDFVRSARAKGLPERSVILTHVLRPALAAIVTVSGMAFGRMLGGAVLVESVFSWPGLGEYAYRSALALDLRAIMGVSLVIAAVYILVNLVVDILYAVIDPRIRLG